MEWGKAPSVSPESRSTDGGAHSHKPILTLSRVSNNIHVGEVCRAERPMQISTALGQPAADEIFPFFPLVCLFLSVLFEKQYMYKPPYVIKTQHAITSRR